MPRSLASPWRASSLRGRARLLAQSAAEAAAPSATGVTTLRCGTLIDGRAATPQTDVAIRIENGRIVSVGPFKASDASTTATGEHDHRPLARHLPAGSHRRARPHPDQDRRLPGRSPAALVGVQGAARSRRRGGDAAVRLDDDPDPRRRGRLTTRTSTCARRSRKACSSGRGSRAPATTCRSRAAAATSTSSARRPRSWRTVSSSMASMRCAKRCARRSSTAVTGSRCSRVAR